MAPAMAIATTTAETRNVRRRASEVWSTKSSVKPLRQMLRNSPTDPNPTETMTIVVRMSNRTTP